MHKLSEEERIKRARERCRKYYSKNREKSLNREKEWYYYNKYQLLERRQKLMAKARKLIGDKCLFCGKLWNPSLPKLFAFHEIYGKKHELCPQIHLKHPEDFIPLCFHCHRMLGRLKMAKDNGKLEIVLKFLNLMGMGKIAQERT